MCVCVLGGGGERMGSRENREEEREGPRVHLVLKTSSMATPGASSRASRSPSASSLASASVPRLLRREE